MSRLRSLPIFVVCAVTGGLACIASVIGVLHRTRPDAYPLTAVGTGFLLLAAAAGVMAAAVFRGNCRRTANRIAEMAASGRLARLPLHDVEMRPLMTAVNDLVDFANARIADAELRVRELEIQLKVAQLERQHAEAIIRSISDAVLVTDRFDELVLANESAARALEFPLDGTGRAPIDRILSDGKIVELIREMRKGGSPNEKRVVEHRVRHQGHDRTFRVTLSCVADGARSDASPRARQGAAGCDTAGVVCVLHDMTREKEIAEMKNDFVSHVSHELRTPLASIRAYVEMLVDGEAGDEKVRREFYEIIQAEANRLGRLIDNILNISRIESGLVRVNKRPLSLSVIMKEAVEVIVPQARTKNITVEERLPPAFFEVLADKDMLYQAVLNLLSNAVKYTPEGGRLTIEAVVDESRKKVVARVSDTGVGIPPKDLPFVFDKFYRVEANAKMAKGTGLGLSLVKHIVEGVHHGKVFAQSAVGAGSTFGFELELV